MVNNKGSSYRRCWLCRLSLILVLGILWHTATAYNGNFECHQIPRISLARRNVRRGMEMPKPMPMVARRPSTKVSMIWTPDSDQKLGENKGFCLFFSPFLSKFFRHKDD
jgi:hypothetical protein